MGATEILQALRKGDELTSREIAERLECPTSSVKKGLKRLLKDVSASLEFRPLTSGEKEERYHQKIGSRIHVYWLSS